MTYYLALLRGINVGGRNRVPMKELSAAMEAESFQDITTYLQSGNVLFGSHESDVNLLADQLTALIEEQFGTTTPVVMRTFEELDRTLSSNPFLETEPEFKWLHVLFLDRSPDEADIARLDPERSPGDHFVVDGRDVFVHYPNGSRRSKLTIDYFERILGVTATGRNWNTVSKLHALMADHSRA
jgi:uncharacterized protein (DUF1697 family)